MKHVEIELRFEILNPSELDSFTAPLTKLGTKRMIDIYLDDPSITLIKQGIYLRIRDNKKVDIKFNRECLLDPTLELQPYCEEYSYALPLSEHDLASFNAIVTTLGLTTIDEPDFDTFKKINNLNNHRIVDKMRTSFAKDAFTITIDKVDQLGSFLEIELMTTTLDSLNEVKKTMEEFLLPLTLKPLKTGYDSLMLRKQNFEQYLQSRFILDEDKPLRKELFEQEVL